MAAGWDDRWWNREPPKEDLVRLFMARLSRLRSAGDTDGAVRFVVRGLEEAVDGRPWSVATHTTVLPAVIAALGRGSRWRFGLSTYTRFVDHSKDKDGAALLAVVSSLRGAARWQSALQLARHGDREGLSIRLASVACAEATEWRRALGVLPSIEGERHRSAALGAFVAGLQWQRAVLLANDAESGGMSRNAAMRACGQARQWRRCLGILQGSIGSNPRMLTENSVGISLACLEAATQWRAALGVVSTGVALARGTGGCLSLPRVFGINRAAGSCAAAAQWRSALGVIRLLSPQGRDATTRSVAMKALEHGAQWGRALRLVSKPDAGTRSFSSAVAACGKAAQWRAALGVLALRQSRQVSPEVKGDADRSLNTALAALARARRWEVALRVLAAHGRRGAGGARPDAVSFATAALGAVQARQWAAALRVAAGARRRRFDSPDLRQAEAGALREGSLWAAALARAGGGGDWLQSNIAMHSLVRAGRWRRALALSRSMQQRRLSGDHTTLAVLAQAHEQGRTWRRALSTVLAGTEHQSSAAIAAARRWRVALSVLQQWARAGGNADSAAPYNAAATACGMALRWRRAVGVLGIMQSRGVAEDPQTHTTIVTSLSAAARWVAALRLAAAGSGSAGELGAADNLYLRRATAAGALQKSQWRVALGQIRTAISDVGRVDLSGLVLVAKACRAGVRWQEALGITRMAPARPREDSLSNRQWSFILAAACGACERAQEPRAACRVLEGMIDRGVVPWRAAYTAALAACHGRGVWEEALQLFETLVRRGAAPDPKAYKYAIAACHRGRQLRRALQLVERMRMCQGGAAAVDRTLAGDDVAAEVARAALHYANSPARADDARGLSKPTRKPPSEPALLLLRAGDDLLHPRASAPPLYPV
eukprot:TRINITY_DN16325_c0_g1_i2.p1 TRINITY_DN16325_c0_g1~~TRINITY_DN16325_c0_g1_i2.p1  ORF type:complete len:889 (+),score=229.03 TRINITY_DN16325_c0_g1_i2:196-2862(+)